MSAEMPCFIARLVFITKYSTTYKFYWENYCRFFTQKIIPEVEGMSDCLSLMEYNNNKKID